MSIFEWFKSTPPKTVMSNGLKVVTLMPNEELIVTLPTGKVIEKLEDGRLVIDCGYIHGVRENLCCDILKTLKEVFDLDGTSLGILEIKEAQGIVESVQENKCILIPVNKKEYFLVEEYYEGGFFMPRKCRVTEEKPTNFDKVEVGFTAKFRE
jgi:hypothetical protein